MKKIKKKKLMYLFCFTLLIFFFSIIYFYFLSNRNTINTYIEIPQDTSAKKVAQILEDKGIIKNKYIFLLYLKFNKYKIAAGKYYLSNKMSLKKICEELQKGIVYKKTIKFTIPEGFTVIDIAKRLDMLGIVKKEDFINEIKKGDIDFKYKFIGKNVLYPYEGYLFPDTYEVYPNTSAKDIIIMMLNRFTQVYESIKQFKKTNLDLKSTVILASIVEKEAKYDSERSLIAGVFLNRLNKNIKLESCATVEYLLPKHKEVLTYNDLKIDSYYNTYKYNGLPPSAISNPGKKSLLSALNPQKTDYLYFVLKKNGYHHFSKTYKEHLEFQKQNEGEKQ
ncbi:endolytic transglycosylase MltG [Caldicellulosiruptoraceae bacterium PP1]